MAGVTKLSFSAVMNQFVNSVSWAQYQIPTLFKISY